MRQQFLRRILICLIPTLLAAYVVASAYTKYERGEGGFTLGVDLVGGTILVYEIDQQRMELERQAAEARGEEVGVPGEDGRTIERLAAALKRRIDPADLLNVTIRPVGSNRVEIVLPFGGSSYRANAGGKKDVTQAKVDEVKRLIAQVGSLEFRIVANTFDDDAGIKAAEDYLKDANNAGALKNAAENGLPPPMPGEYPYALGSDNARYAWVPLSKMERHQLRLNNAQETNPDVVSLNSHWQRCAAARAKNELVRITTGSGGRNDPDPKQISYVLYSRDCINKRIPDAERQAIKYEYFLLTRLTDSVKVGGNISITAQEDTTNISDLAVAFRFNSVGAREFFEMTKKNEPSGGEGGLRKARQLAILLDGELVSFPTLNQAIGERGQITGGFTKEEVSRLVNILRAGALPATLKSQPVSESTIGPTLGLDTIRSGTIAIGLAFVLVLAFMVWYYRFAGLVACIALFANLILTIAFMVLVNATFTLPGLAGLVLTLGMAVDANVLIYERLREERDRGASLPTALRNGYERAFATIIDTHLCSIFTAVVLYTVGNDQLKGFGVSLTAGLVISLFTSLYVTRTIFDIWFAKGWLTKLKMLRMFTSTNINFMAIRKPMFALTVALTIFGLGLFLVRGREGLNVDFIGGTAYGGQLEKPVDITTLRDLLSKERQERLLQVESVEALAEKTGVKNQYRIAYRGAEPFDVTLANDPNGSTPEEQLADLKKRFSLLADASVEQTFLSSEPNEGGTSRFFTVRTTERESVIVQRMIGRLFTDDAGKSLLRSTELKTTKPDADSWQIKFHATNDPTTPAYASLSYLKTLLEQKFLVELSNRGEQKASSRAQRFDLVGIGEPKDGRYAEMKLVIPEDGPREVGESVVAGVQRDFQATPQPERLETFDGALASEMRTKAFYAILASWIGVLLYLWFRFGSWQFGAAAVVCLIHDLAFTLGAIALCHYLYDLPGMSRLGIQDFKIDLPAVAALLTLVGYSVNDTIVVFDRIREVRGKSPELTHKLINDSVNQTLSRTLLASGTTGLVVLVLFAAGGDGVHLFAFVMCIGVLVGTYSSIYIASPLLIYFGEGETVNAKEEEAGSEEAAANDEDEDEGDESTDDAADDTGPRSDDDAGKDASAPTVSTAKPAQQQQKKKKRRR